MKNKVYVVTMYRYGSRSLHSYLLGVFTTKTKAEKEAFKERDYRGGNKYYPECLEIILDSTKMENFKTIIHLESNPNFINED